MIKLLEKNCLYTSKAILKKDRVFDNISGPISSGSLNVLDGQNIGGTFYPTSSIYYSEYREPVNWDGSFKRVIYKQDQINLFDSISTKVKYPNIFIDLGDRTRSVRIPKKFYGEKIIPSSLKITDKSNIFFDVKISDDGEGNLVTTESQVRQFYKILPKNNVPKRLVSGVSYTLVNGTQITKEQAVQRYSDGLDVIETPVYEKNSIRMPDYDPVNERLGTSLDSFGEYLIAASELDDDSFSNNKSGKVILYKTHSGSNYTPIKIFQSPFQSSVQLEMNDVSFLKNEYGDFILDSQTGYLCSSQSYYKDFYGKSVSIDGDFCAITSPFTKKCLQLCETGSGLVYCYQGNKGGQDNWGIINVLEGESPEDGFGYSVSIKDDILAVGAPFYSGSRGAVYIFRKKRYQSDDPIYFTPTASSFENILLTDVTGSVLDASVDDVLKNIKIQDVQASFWFPTSQICYELITSNVFEPIISDTGSFGYEEYLSSDSTDPYKIFTIFDQVPNYVKEDYVWKIEAKIVGDNINDTFGGCISVASDFIVVGNANPTGSQLAWVYAVSSSLDPETNRPSYTWTKENTLQITDGDSVLQIPSEFDLRNSYSGFGTSVSTDGNYISVGAPYDRLVDGNFIGACVVYKRSFGRDLCGNQVFVREPIKKLTPYAISDQDYLFGFRCDLKNEKLIVSSPKNSIIKNGVDREDDKFTIVNFENSSSVTSKVFAYIVSDTDVSLITELGYKKDSFEPDIFYGYDVSVTKTDYFVGAPVFSYATSSSLIPTLLSQSVIANPNNWENRENVSMSGSILFYKLDTEQEHVGNIFYDRGQLVFTNTGDLFSGILKGEGSSGFSVEYSSEESIFRSEVVVPIEPGEFTFSTNPTSTYGKDILLDVNRNGAFDFNDLNFILKYINGDRSPEGVDGIYVQMEGSDDCSWWKDDNLLTESEDLIIAEGLISSAPSEIYSDSVISYIKNYLFDNLVLDINGDGVIDNRDANLLWKYWIGKIDTDSVDSNVNGGCLRQTLVEILEYINLILGKSIPYPKKQNSSGSIYNVGNGGLIKPEFFNYISSSYSDITGSYLSTYITSVGLYSGGDLILVGKLGTPIKNIVDYPINLSIKFNLF